MKQRDTRKDEQQLWGTWAVEVRARNWRHLWLQTGFSRCAAFDFARGVAREGFKDPDGVHHMPMEIVVLIAHEELYANLNVYPDGTAAATKEGEVTSAS